MVGWTRTPGKNVQRFIHSFTADELKDLSILSFSEPWVNFDRMVEKAYNRNKQRFEEFGLKLDNITYRINKME